MVSVPAGTKNNVYPSGGDFATDVAAITVPPPVRFSTTIGLPNRSDSFGANCPRARMSIAPPAPSGSTRVIGLFG